MRRLPSFLALAWLAIGHGFATPVDFALVSVPGPMAHAHPRALTVELIAFNRDPQPKPATWNDWTDGEAVLHGDKQAWRVVLEPVTDKASVNLSPGQFATRQFRFDLPPAAHGRLLLELRPPTRDPLTLLFPAVEPPSAHLATAPHATASDDDSALPSPRPIPAADKLDRAFLNRFGLHEPIYFLYGSDAPAAKFQFSFKYRFASFAEAGDDANDLPGSLQFGFTQRSLWDIEANSSPFYDTSYIPEVFYEKLALESPAGASGMTWLGWQAGYRHESNGRDGDISRSLNTLWARAVVQFGTAEGWHLLLIPEIQSYISDLGNNPDIARYRGYGRLRTIVSHGADTSLTAAYWAGRNFDHATFQLDLSVPIRIRLFDVGTYFRVQYFNGYGESLLSYQDKSETIRAGFAFVR